MKNDTDTTYIGAAEAVEAASRIVDTILLIPGAGNDFHSWGEVQRRLNETAAKIRKVGETGARRWWFNWGDGPGPGFWPHDELDRMDELLDVGRMFHGYREVYGATAFLQVLWAARDAIRAAYSGNWEEMGEEVRRAKRIRHIDRTGAIRAEMARASR